MSREMAKQAVVTLLLVLFLGLSTHGQVSHSRFLDFSPQTVRLARGHVHGAHSHGTGDMHSHDHRIPCPTGDSSSRGRGESPEHDADSHIHPRDFTQGNAPFPTGLSLPATDYGPIPEIATMTGVGFAIPSAHTIQGPDPPLYLRSSALLI